MRVGHRTTMERNEGVNGDEPDGRCCAKGEGDLYELTCCVSKDTFSL